MLQYVTNAPEGPLCATHLLIIFLWCFVKFASVIFELLLRQGFDLWPDCDLDLGRRNLNHVQDTPSHYALSFCEVPSNLLQKFMSSTILGTIWPLTW